VPVAGKKSDHGESFVLANVLRTDIAIYRALPADTELAPGQRGTAVPRSF
jgi:hypothetical protein